MVPLLTKKKKAKELIQNTKISFSKLETGNPKLATCYLIWRNPYMTIGGDTFISDMLAKCGLQNVYETENRYPEITVEEIKKSGAKLILLPSEPFPFKGKHVEEIKTHIPGAKILLVDGEMFSWYGSRMLYAAQYFGELMNKIYEPPVDNYIA